MASRLKPHFLGERLIAAAKLARWERQIVAAVASALKLHETHALEMLRHVRVVASIPSDMFGEETFADDAVGPVERSVYGVFAEIRDGTAHKFGIGATDLPEIDVTTRAANLRDHVVGVGQKTADRLTHSLTQGVNAGEDYEKLADRVSSIFDSAESDAMRIARTEVAGAANGLSYEYAGAVNAGGLSLQKTWLSTLDERTRGNGPKDEFDHVGADGETVGMDEPFVLTGEELMYPGDENGSPGNIINCRCTPIFDEAGTEYGDDLHIDAGE